MHIHPITSTTFRRARPSIGAVAAGMMLGMMQAAVAEPATKASPTNAPSYFQWAGAYIGVNFGYGFGQSRTDALFSDASMGTPLLATGSSSKSNGVLGGAQTGYNWQAGNWLVGLEIDIQHTNQRATTSYVCPGAVCNPAITGFDAPASLVHSQELDWFGTLRARLGVTATPDVLLYATGGLAVARLAHVGTISGASVAPLLDDNGAPVLDDNGNPVTAMGSNSAGLFEHTTKLGWAAGAGLETHLIGNLSGKIEYLHMSFGADSVSAGNSNNATPLALALRSRITDDIVRVGLNYRLVESGQDQPDDKPGVSKSRRRAKAPPPPPPWIWTGYYFGGHVGYSRGHADVTLNDPSADPSVDNFRSPFGSLTGGLQVGYNYLLPSRFLLGIEADASFLNYLSADDVAWSRTRIDVDRAQKIDYIATVRGRFGYAFPQWMIYATGGVAWSLGRFLESPGATDDVDKVIHLYKGWAAGIGTEVPIEHGWTAKLEYLYASFGHQDVMFQSGVAAGSSFDIHTLRAGLNYNFAAADAGDARATTSASSPTEFDNWAIHGQTTYIQQGYPPFHSPYLGPNSFTPWAQTRNTWTVSAFLGLKLWQGGELYYNPELLQGFGLHDTTGAAGFPNGEAQKSNFPYFRYSTSRLFLRQTIGLGGEQEKSESGYGQLGGNRDVSRLTFWVGRLSVHDIFDNNSYALDPRLDFMNWSIWAAGAFDYPADKVGLGYGAVSELNQKYWALRVGYFLTGNQPNSNEFDMTLFRRGAYVGELETRHSVFSLPGKVRFGLWADTYFSGSYREAVDLSLAVPNLDPTDAIVATRTGRTKYGYYVNFEQSLTEHLAIFGRWSWNDGRNEISAFTDIDRSLMFGAAITGKAWGRPDDRIGLAGAVNALSPEHRDYIAAGGLGVLIGDGMLNYHNERILETYYAMRVLKGLTMTFDYQYMINPAYNADRGPISFFSGRLHGEF
jgi:high affinity Mn2+ porin